MSITSLVKNTRIIPILTQLRSAEEALNIALALKAAELTVVEITLRSAPALAAIEKISNAIPDMIVGAGTVIDLIQITQAKSAGAKFLVSPGLLTQFYEKTKEIDLPYLPGTVTPSEIMHARTLGLKCLKFFPAEAAGGVNRLRQLAPVFPDIQFCPTGGVTLQNMQNYLALKNVLFIGGAWIQQQLIDNKDWQGITQLAKEARRQASAATGQTDNISY